MADPHGGVVRVTDFMPPRTERPDLVRIVEGMSGSVDMEMELVLRFDYGRLVPWARRDRRRLTLFVAGPDQICLRTDVAVQGAGPKTVAEFRVAAGEVRSFVLSWSQSHEAPHKPPHPGGALESTIEWWRAWSAGMRYSGRKADEVRHSLMVLKALTFAPTGGIVAAPTTSLPEQLGGVRNWDYRYCWLRDAAFTLVGAEHRRLH